MAQGRAEDILKPVPTPMPTPTHTEVIDGLKEDLSNWMQKCLEEENKLASLEEAILADGDIEFDAPEVLPEQSVSEAMYEKIAPYFVSAKTYLKHILENNKHETLEARNKLHEMLGITHEQFAALSREDQQKYLMTLCVISMAILQDLRVLANKYVIEIDQLMTIAMIEEITIEKTVNAVTTILFDMALYHPDHQADFAAYRRGLYSSIGAVDMSIHEFFAIMHGHASVALDFINNYRSHIKEAKVAGPLTQAVGFTLLPPPPANPVPAAVPVVELKPEEKGRCAIL